MEVGNRLIAALDTPTRRDADAFLAKLDGVPSWIKIGLELFCAEGPGIVADYAEHHSVMLDLKLHDISETVGRAAGRVAGLGAGLLTVHAAGGRKMLEAAVKGAGTTKVLAITVLTSLDQKDHDETGAGALQDVVLRRARLAHEAGCFGVVASPHEVALIKAEVPQLHIVTPGVRPAGASAGDQKRVMTPGEARKVGADMVVVGRPLRDDPDPAAAARRIIAELS